MLRHCLFFVDNWFKTCYSYYIENERKIVKRGDLKLMTQLADLLQDHLATSVKPDLKPFDTFTVDEPGFNNPYRPDGYTNGYIVIPNDLPIDFTDPFYQQLDTRAVQGLTISGYLTIEDGERHIYLLDAHTDLTGKIDADTQQVIDRFKAKTVPIIGFDNNHLYYNDVTAQEGATDLANQLRELVKG